MQGSRSGAGVCFWVRLLVARRLRKWRRRTGKSVRSLGLCSSVPNSCFFPNLRAYRGMLGHACCRSPAATLECVVGRRALACVLGHCVRNGRVSGDWRVWACWIPARAATTSPASRFSRRPKRAPALAAVGFLCCILIVKAFHCPERPVFALRCTPRGRGVGWTSRRPLCPTYRARPHVPGSLAHCVVARSLGCGTHGGYEGLGLCLPRKQAFSASCERRPPPFWARPMRAAESVRNATWLILPVVICLSQRLSHACLCETGDLVNLVHFWRYSTPFHSDLHIRTLVPFLILWSTWTQRNAAKYHGAHFTATGTILEVQRHLRTLYAARIMTSIQWKGDLHRALAMGFCFRPIAPQAPRVVRWSTPSPAWFKLNSDGSSLGNPGPAAAAGIIRDADGQVRLAYQFALGTATSVVSELIAVWRGLELARAHSLAPIVVEVDATVVLQLLQSRASGIWEVQHLIMRIVQLQQELGSDVRHIFREANGAADHLAKDAASRQLTRVMYQEDITGVLRGIIRLDKMGTPYLRRWTLGWAVRSASGVHRSSRPFCRRCAPGLNWPGRASGAVTLKKLECSKQAYALYTLAWDNIIGFRSYYVGLRDRTFAKDVFINQERKLGARRRSDTVLVSTINDADQGSADVAFRTPPAPYEKSKSLGSGGSMVARLKLKGIDGRAPPGVEPAA
ncbi:UNVERIFIED_CONTAM: hypothetical protein Sindi_2902000 [Sesamum indicum]